MRALSGCWLRSRACRFPHTGSALVAKRCSDGRRSAFVTELGDRGIRAHGHRRRQRDRNWRRRRNLGHHRLEGDRLRRRRLGCQCLESREPRCRSWSCRSLGCRSLGHRRLSRRGLRLRTCRQPAIGSALHTKYSAEWGSAFVAKFGHGPVPPVTHSLLLRREAARRA